MQNLLCLVLCSVYQIVWKVSEIHSSTVKVHVIWWKNTVQPALFFRETILSEKLQWIDNLFKQSVVSKADAFPLKKKKTIKAWLLRPVGSDIQRKHSLLSLSSMAITSFWREKQIKLLHFLDRYYKKSLVFSYKYSFKTMRIHLTSMTDYQALCRELYV